MFGLHRAMVDSEIQKLLAEGRKSRGVLMAQKTSSMTAPGSWFFVSKDYIIEVTHISRTST